MNTWRLLITPPSHGAWNMALDETILEKVGRNETIPTLRLYSWKPACLSLGYAQPVADVDMARLRSHQWDLVRRATGGRAVLHIDELTYSVIAPLDEPRVAGTVLESYYHLARALLSALNMLNMPAIIKSDKLESNPKNPNPVCFEVPSTYEITVTEKKLIGSAQARKKEGVLQHGSLPLTGDLTRIVQVLTYKDESARNTAAKELLAHATTAETVLGRKVTWEEAADAFVSGFRSVLGLEFKKEDLTPDERKRTEELVQSKYDHPSWTER
jgi:lipoate-protein ligase A